MKCLEEKFCLEQLVGSLTDEETEPHGLGGIYLYTGMLTVKLQVPGASTSDPLQYVVGKCYPHQLQPEGGTRCIKRG